MKTEEIENAAANWCKDNDWYHAYVTAKKYGNSLFEAGAEWQKEQYKDLIQSHAELLEALKELLNQVATLEWEQSIKALRNERKNLLSASKLTASKAIEKAENTINSLQ